MFKKMLHKITLTCKEATLLMELKDANKSNKLQNIRLSIHLMICKYCRLYIKKSAIIKQIIQQKKEEYLANSAEQENILELKNKINKRLSE